MISANVGFVFLLLGCAEETTRLTANASAPKNVWWQQETVATWTGFGTHADRRWLEFVRQLDTTACDRGVFYGPSDDHRGQQSVVDFYHQQGLHVTSFLSIDNWQPDEAAVAELISRLQQQLDDGCDGVHLDMLFSVADPKRTVEESKLAVQAIAKLRDAVHTYPRKPRAMFAGNAWQLDTRFSLQVASLCDVAWIESWGHDDLDLVRIARVARSLGRYQKPTWYHWQPDNNEQARVRDLVNLPKALYSSCMLEGAIFLCNYRYPVPLVHRDEQGRDVTDWKMFPINSGWKRSVLQYAQFAKKHAALFDRAKPQAPVLVAFKPHHVAEANKIMRDLLISDISFDVRVCGKWPLFEMTQEDMEGYYAVITPDVSWLKQFGTQRVCGSVALLPVEAIIPIRDFCRVRGEANVVTRVYQNDSRMLLHLKQHGYDEEVDDLPQVGPLTLTFHCPRKIRRITCLSPDRPGSMILEYSQEGSQTDTLVPSLTFYNLLVIDLDSHEEQ